MNHKTDFATQDELPHLAGLFTLENDFKPERDKQLFVAMATKLPLSDSGLA